MAMIRERWHRADWLAALAIFLALAAAASSLAPVIEPQPLAYRNLPFPVLNSPVRAGEPLVMLVSRCANVGAPQPYLVSRELVRVSDRVRQPLAPTHSTARPGCETYQAQTAALPDDIEPGLYVYRGIADVPSLFRDHAVPWETEPFEVVAAEGR